MKDKTLSPFYRNSDMEKLKVKFAYYLASASGGDMDWVGKTMKEAH